MSSVAGLSLASFPNRAFEEAGVPQRHWAEVKVSRRLQLIRRARHRIAERSREFACLLDREPAESLVAEVLPLLEAFRFLEHRAVDILRPRKMDAEDRPFWLRGVEIEIRREPLGVVLVIGPVNYPLFLPGVHAIQALVAGNAVVVKPGKGGRPVMDLLGQYLGEAGLDRQLFRVLDDTVEEGQQATDAHVDKVILTGSNQTGLAVLAKLAARGTPSVMELSGFDPVFVLPSASLDLVVNAVRFGVRLNGGNTCIAPRIVYAPTSMAQELRARLDCEGVSIPVIAASAEEALAHAQLSGYALGASIFGDIEEAQHFAARVNAGVVVINDMIVPTADPRVPFGGRGRSGFGVTRGAEGLLEMTALKTIVVRRSSWLPHFAPTQPGDDALFASVILASHGGSLAGRVRAGVDLIRGAMRRR